MREDRISPRDAEELACCFTKYARGLFGYACVLARGDQALAEDLVQAAFEAAGQAWRQVLHGLAEEQRGSWLRRTLENIAASSFRREAALRERLPRIEVRYRKTPADPVEQAYSVKHPASSSASCGEILSSLTAHLRASTSQHPPVRPSHRSTGSGRKGSRRWQESPRDRQDSRS